MVCKPSLLKTVALITLLLTLACSCREEQVKTDPAPFDLVLNTIPQRWDEAIPLGNGMLGALIWLRDSTLRLSLDRADLWDLRPMTNLQGEKWKFSWVYSQWKDKRYSKVQDEFDKPYDNLPAPSKIPAGALEFDTRKLGKITSARLDLSEAMCEITWDSGARMLVFVSAVNMTGWYRFENLGDSVSPQLVPPAYASEGDGKASEMSFHDLSRLGYRQGEVLKGNRFITYDQEGWGGFRYKISVAWNNLSPTHEGCWSISSEGPGIKEHKGATDVLVSEGPKGFWASFTGHRQWWHDFWSRSSITLPDTVLQKQWYLEMYKFGSVARSDAPPVSLQAVWTADNGKLPPWKGDFHHDLNTQLSYWPAYASNHTDLSSGFTNWLTANRNAFKKYTEEYFETGGLNVPGVTTLTGEPMGGWIQYSFGPTVSAWLAHHFYLQWRYTMDREFLAREAYPWLRETALFLSEFSVKDEVGLRKFPLSSSPEIFDNSEKAWFGETTNYDLSLARWTFAKASELAMELGLEEEANKWKVILGEWPAPVADSTGLLFAPGVQYTESHRHFSHLMAWHPLGLVDISMGDSSRLIIGNTLRNLEARGTDWWCGYSWSWLGNLYARALDGDKAADALRIFSTCFCLPNSFHVNGDQSGTGKSKFTYRPFTLEGNFAFASGIQEMLIQSHTGVVKIFPAIPASWENVSFSSLRTEGAFLVSAVRTANEMKRVTVLAEKGGTLKIENPFSKGFSSDHKYSLENNQIIVTLKPGSKAEFRSR